MTNSVMISLAPVAADSTEVIPEYVAEDILESAEYGASIVHLHVRNQHGKLTDDVTDFRSTIDRVRQHSSLVIQASTGGVSDMNIQQRCAPLSCAGVEMASLNVGSVNLGDVVYLNPAPDVEWCAKRIIQHHIVPEFEVFEIGMIHTIQELQKHIEFPHPILYNLVLGHRGAAPATIDALISLRQFLPRDALWGITHFGRRDFGIFAAAIGMGACEVRIGFEDSRYVNATEQVTRNAPLVKKLAHLIEAADKKVATPEEARKIIGIL